MEPRRRSRHPVTRSGRTLAIAWVVVIALASAACSTGSRMRARPVLVPELYESERYPLENIDSLAVWAKGHWLLCTAKSTDRLLVFDTASGRLVREFGETGTAPGQFRRPNGVAVVGDLVLVVERDNRRVQVLRLPDLSSLGLVGVGILRNPYGIAAMPGADGAIEVYVTDSYLDAEGRVPPAPALGERVKHFRLRRGGGTLSAELIGSFGATSGAGVLHLVESIAADPAYDRLLIADEDQGARDIKVYDLAGGFTGVVLGRGHYAHEPEGIALVSCGGAGWWITTDQRQERTFFHLYERASLNYAGAFVGHRVANTDGIAVTEAGCPAAPGGALFAVDDDEAVAAFDWRSIAAALDLPVGDCAGPGGRPRDAARTGDGKER